MTRQPVTTAERYRNRVGEEIGVSGWIEITQAMIDAFADLTFDHQFIHVDPQRAAAEAPFGGTVAHGFLTLSLLSRLAGEARPEIAGTRMGLNYGFDKIRFLHPVPAGARVRARLRLLAAEERVPGEVTYCHEVTVEIDGVDRPALVAHWLTRLYLA